MSLLAWLAAGLWLVGATNAKPKEQTAAPFVEPRAASWADRWLIFDDAHDRLEPAREQAEAIRRRHYPEATVIETDHYDGLPPGLFLVCLGTSFSREDAYARVRGIRTLGHRTWTRFSGPYVATPNPESLMRRLVRLALRSSHRVVEVLPAGRLRVALVESATGVIDLVVVRPRRLRSDLIARATVGGPSVPCTDLRVEDVGPLRVEIICEGAPRRYTLGPDDKLRAK